MSQDSVRTTPEPTPSTRVSSRARSPRVGASKVPWVVALVVVVMITLGALPLILSGSLRGRGAYDSVNFHEPTIRVFAKSWPASDFSKYLSATTPMYHWVLAGGLRAVYAPDEVFGAWEDDLTPEIGHGLPSEAEGGPARVGNPTIESQRRLLQVLGLGFSLAWLGGLALFVSRRLGGAGRSPWMGLVLVLPLLCSPYITQSAIWLLPDNLAWGLVCLTLIAVCVMVERAAERDEAAPTVSFARFLPLLAVIGVTLVLLVFARQIHIWIVGVVWAGVWMVGAITTRQRLGLAPTGDAGLLHLRDVLGGSRGLIDARVLRSSIAWWAIGIALSIPAWGLMLWFYRLWGNQLVPPGFEGWYPKQTQWATLGFGLGLVGMYGIFFAGWWWQGFTRLWRDERGWVIIGAGAGLLAASVPATFVDHQMGRFGGIWGLIDLGPQIAGREVILMVMSSMGGIVAVSLLRQVSRPVRWVMLAALAGFVAAQSQSWQLWQRYHEAYWLMWIVMLIALRRDEVAGAMNPLQPWRFAHALRIVGPAVLACLLLAMGVLLYQTGRDEADEGYRPGVVEALPGTEGASPMMRLKGLGQTPR